MDMLKPGSRFRECPDDILDDCAIGPVISIASAAGESHYGHVHNGNPLKGILTASCIRLS